MVEPVVTTLVIMAGSSLFGFGALIATLAGPHKLVVVTMMLMMIAMQYARPNDLDF